MRQAEVTVRVNLEADADLYEKLVRDYNKLAEKVEASENSEAIQSLFKFSKTFKQFLQTISVKLDGNSTTASVKLNIPQEEIHEAIEKAVSRRFP